MTVKRAMVQADQVWASLELPYLQRLNGISFLHFVKYSHCDPSLQLCSSSTTHFSPIYRAYLAVGVSYCRPYCRCLNSWDTSLWCNLMGAGLQCCGWTGKMRPKTSYVRDRLCLLAWVTQPANIRSVLTNWLLWHCVTQYNSLNSFKLIYFNSTEWRE